MFFSLVSHPWTEPTQVKQVEVWGRIEPFGAVLYFAVPGAVPQFPREAAPVRADGLWKTTCFEMFIQPSAGERYFEFNFSPSKQWAAYEFDAYRQGMRQLAMPQAPVIQPFEAGIRTVVDLPELPPLPWRIGLSAVIEEKDGTKSYWALAHSPGKPDFHHPDCFALELPAPEQA